VYAMNSRITLLKRIVLQSIMPSGIVRYNITYIPKLGAYRITLVGSREGISGDALRRLMDALSSNGFVVRVKVSKVPLFNVVYLYAVPKVNVP